MHDRKVLRAALGFLYGHLFFLYWPLYGAYKKRADASERAWIRGLVRPGAAIVDVGANVGVYSVFFADLVGSTGKVFSFEPDPQNFIRLKRTTASRRPVAAFESAVGSQTGSIRLYQSKGMNFDHRTYANPDDVQSVEVPITRLDDVDALRGVEITLIKIDVQGFEPAVLAGAQALLERNPEAKLLLEYYPWGLRSSGSGPAEFIDLLKAEDYIVTTFTDEPDLLLTGVSKAHDRNWYRNLVLSRELDASVRGMTRVQLE